MTALLVLALVADAGAPPAIAGRYRWIGGEAETQKLDQAIDTVVRKMNIFIRGIARRRMRAPNLPAPELEILIDGGAIVIRRPGKPEVSAPADGRPIEWRHPDGDRFTVRHWLEGGILYQRFEDSRSSTLNRFVLDADGRRLVVETTTTSSYFRVPLQFRMTYAR